MMLGSNPQGKGRIIPADALAVAEAATVLRDGGIVAVPTETVYGLAADASNASAVAKIYAAKGRPDFNPLIVHVPDIEAAEAIADFDDTATALADRFWPGALTLVLPIKADAKITPAVTAGLPTIALRCPSHPVMQALLLASGLVVAAPSANRSGGISPTTAAHVAESLGIIAPLIIDAGACRAGLESTIVAVRENGWQLLRPGPITAEQIEAVLGTPPLDQSDDSIEAPGQLASHYAPSKAVRLNAETAMSGEWHIGFGMISGDENLSASGKLAEAAANLFAALHRADASDRLAIAVAPIANDGIGIAINDRLQRAAAR
jgi:L-threonylcarbamoyladenylate synthase